ncbi:MAG: efflux transporter outer membrane subunit [Betaproteobacteria bacterium]|nr:efflux transporter outer membrane subunit [Betaproteobacteria bacterium]
MNRRLVPSALALMLGACSLAPTYQVPDSAPAPQSFKESQGWKTAVPADSVSRGAWWEQFQDPVLNALEAKVGAANQDIKAALARLDQAQAAVGVARSYYFPTATANASSVNQRVSTKKPFYFAAFDPKYQDNLLGLNVSYEVDVWGRIRNAVAASDALAMASAADLATLDLSTRAELAKDYFALRSYDAEQGVLDRAVESYRTLYELTQQLFEGGGASAADVALAKVQWQNATTQATDNRLKRSQMEHAIAVLTGESASTFSLPAQAGFTALPPPVAVGLPSSLLERRPDIAAAERRVAAANAEIGVARAAFFPVFGLNAAGGFENGNTAGWLSAPSRYWAMGPTATLTVFDAGRRQAVTDQAHAVFDEAAANYRQTVLQAFQEVEDNLAALRDLEQGFQSVSEANQAAGEALKQANFRYQGGIASYLEVMTAQNQALQSEFAVSDLRARRLMASVQLVKALGGGWQAGAQGAAPDSGHEHP